jgi:hypothetical protein
MKQSFGSQNSCEIKLILLELTEMSSLNFGCYSFSPLYLLTSKRRRLKTLFYFKGAKERFSVLSCNTY